MAFDSCSYVFNENKKEIKTENGNIFWLAQIQDRVHYQKSFCLKQSCILVRLRNVPLRLQALFFSGISSNCAETRNNTGRYDELRTNNNLSATRGLEQPLIRPYNAWTFIEFPTITKARWRCRYCRHLPQTVNGRFVGATVKCPNLYFWL